MTATVGENPSLRDEYRVAYGKFIELNGQYAKLREDVMSGDTKRAAAAAEPLATLEQEVANVISSITSIKDRNSSNSSVFDSTLAQKAESAIGNASKVQQGAYDAKRLANMAVRDEAKNNSPEAQKTTEEQKAGQKVPETTTTESKEGENKAPDDAKPVPSTTVAGKTPAINDFQVKVTGKPPSATVATPGSPAAPNSTTSAKSSKSVPTAPNKRTWNPLGDFSSYTYRISIYGFPPEALNVYKETGRWDNKDLFLIVQSGGASVDGTTADKQGNTFRLDAKRSTGFELDFYIDDLEIETLTNSKETGIAGNSVNFKFKIIEPYGMTFPTKLVQQQLDIQTQANVKRDVVQQIEALQGHYLVAIRFYGYDVNGQLVTSSMYGGNTQDTGSTAALLDSSATFERVFPIVINKFQFRVDGKSTVYDINAKLVAEQVALGAKRGIAVNSVNIQGSTVSEMLGGFGGGTDGLLDQLNVSQQTLRDTKGSIEIADVYEVVFESDELRKSSILDDKQINKDKVPLVKSNSEAEAARAAAEPGAKAMKKSRVMTIQAGTPILQAIDQIITQSKYITDALTFIDSEDAQQPQKNEFSDEVNSKPKTIQWYMVSPVVQVLGFDKLRNDFAYKITYVVKTYDIPYIQANNIKNVPKYPGPHKIYNYWYTGKNSEVISYEQQYNLLYFNAGALTSQNASVNPNSKTPVYQRAAQGADSTGKSDGAFDSVGIIKTFLYSPADQLHAKIKILGDPDFLMPATSGNVQDIMQKWYGPDFTINPNSGQVFIELIFQQAEDYSNVDGLLTPNGNIDFWDFSDNPTMKSLVKGMVFMVTKVTSRFSKGVFTQEFKTILPNFSELSKATTTTGAAPSAREQRAETANKANQSAATAQRTGVTLSPSAGGGRGGQGGPTANQNLDQGAYSSGQKANQTNRVIGHGATPDDDQLLVAGPSYKKKYEQANFYNGDLERAQAKPSDPANKSNRYYGLNSNAGGGRGTVNPTR